MRYGRIRVAGISVVESDNATGQDLNVGGGPGDALNGSNVISRLQEVTEETTLARGAFARLTLGEVAYDISLPDPATSWGAHVYLANGVLGGPFNIKSASGLINGEDAATGFEVFADPFEHFHAICDGADWFVCRCPPLLPIV